MQFVYFDGNYLKIDVVKGRETEKKIEMPKAFVEQSVCLCTLCFRWKMAQKFDLSLIVFIFLCGCIFLCHKNNTEWNEINDVIHSGACLHLLNRNPQTERREEKKMCLKKTLIIWFVALKH